MTRRIYLDYASTTPVDPRVLSAMRPYFSERFGNPGSLHSYGQEAQAALDAARESVAAQLGADFREIIFTGSATEANNLALRGALKAFSFKLPGVSENQKLKANSYKLKPRIIVSAVEHESVLATARDLEREGAELKVLPVDKNGRVDLKNLRAALNKETFLVSVMYANNEVGTIQPISEIAEIISDFKGSISTTHHLPLTTYPLFHTDAAQAFQFLDCSPAALGVDLLTLSAHKIYGPKGAGAMYIKSGVPLGPVLTGGGQEYGLRSGTENVPLVAGLAKAVSLAASLRSKESPRLAKLQKELWQNVKRAAPSARLNGPPLGKDRLPNNLNVYLPGLAADKILTALDLLGVAASAGSACASRATTPSHVLLAMGLGEKRARQSIRFSLGRPTGKEDIHAVSALLRKTLPRL